MTLPLAQLGAVAVVGLTAAASLLAAAGVPWALRALRRVAPAQRAALLRALAAAPVALGLAFGLLSLLPSSLGAIWPHLDHCEAHGGHVHLCLWHPPAATSAAAGLVLAALAAGLAITGGRAALARRREALLLRPLVRAARPGTVEGGTDGTLLLDVEEPFAGAVGLLRPRVLLSTGLLRRLGPALAPAVVAHERAHVQRRDGLWRAVAGALSLAHLPRIRRAVLAELDLAAEQACDEAAAARVGDRTTAAQALLAAERLFHGGRPLGAAPGIGGASLSARVESLLIPRRAALPRWALALAVLVSAAAVAAGAEPLHHATETALDVLHDLEAEPSPSPR